MPHSQLFPYASYASADEVAGDITFLGCLYIHMYIHANYVPLPPKVKEVMFCTPLCLFVTCKIEDFSSILVRRFCYSVCLSVCLSPTGHNFKLIFTKLHHMVEFVIRKKPIVFDVKRSTKAKGQQLR